MKIFLLPAIALFLCFQSISAQDADSLKVVKARWEKKKIAPKTRLLYYHFENRSLFNANEFISIIEIKKPGKKVHLAVGAEEKELITTSNFGKKSGALAAINGTFFDVKNGGSVDFIKAMDKIVNTTRLEKGNKRARHQQAAIIINNRKPEVIKWDGTANWENSINAPEIMLSGPLLTFNNTDQPLDTAAFNRLRHPRTCVGTRPDGTVLLLTVDGRHENSAGLSLFELTRLMRWLGCTTSINLDGGGSTTMWISGFPEDGVINHPSDNKQWDHAGQRKVANVVLVKKN